MRRLLTAGCTALSLALVACGGTVETRRITSNSLTVYSSLPLHGPRGAEGLAVLRGEKLALQEAGGRVGDLKVGLVALDDVEADKQRWSPEQVAQNARQAVRNGTSIAYIGELDNGATAVSLPITNEADILHVAPFSTLTGLTRPSDKGEPDKYYPSGKRTFARLAPNGATEARALASWLQETGAHRVAVADDGGQDGLSAVRDLQRALRAERIDLVDLVRFDPGDKDLSEPAADVVAKEADAVVFAGATPDAGGRLLRAVHQLRPELPLFATSGAARPELAQAAGAAAAELHVVSPILDLDHAPASARRLAERYRAAFGEPAPAAALYGYEAMRSVLQAVRDAGPDGNDRPSIARAFFQAPRRDSVLGPYRFDRVGDTSLTEVSGLRIRDGALRFDRLLDGAAR
jgi:branched-chain amino acid transport system substrate-binding protein